MANKLPSGFKMSKYGVDVRFVEESDAEFILSLRTDPKLSRFLHSTDNDVEKQRQWIEVYKERESIGIDYYFIYSKDGEPFGLNRIYNIGEASCTGGSWLCKPGTPLEDVVATTLIARDIIFYKLGIESDNYDVRKNNKKVLRFHDMMGAKRIGETELDILYSIDKSQYEVGKNNIIRLLNINNSSLKKYSWAKRHQSPSQRVL